jgi:transposase
MAQKERVNSKLAVRQRRYFSEDFKRKKVAELEKKLTTVLEISRQYEVSDSAVYKWLDKYSLMRKKAIRMVVEAESDTARIKALRDHISELERLLGQKQFEIDFLRKQMDIVSDQYGVDLKKKASGTPSSGSGKTEINTDIT